MVRRPLAAPDVQQVYQAVPHLLRLFGGNAHLDYDREADVLYVSLRRPQHATETRSLDDEGVHLRYRGDELVGITILEASKRG
jgi:uncharacterized protein YuzE